MEIGAAGGDEETGSEGGWTVEALTVTVVEEVDLTA